MKSRTASKFPFSESDNKWLFDTTSLIKYGLNLSIQFASIRLSDFDSSKQTERKRRPSVDDSDYESDSDSIMDYEHEPPSPILVPFEAPKSSIRRSSFVKNEEGDPSSLQICHNKIENIINEFFPVVNDNTYITIKNFVCNCMLQQETDIKEFLCRIVNHRHRNDLADIIRTIFIEKFEEIKLENLIDYFNNFLNLAGNVNSLHNPHFYEQYYKIWKFKAEDYLSYHEEYFFAYFNNGGKAPVTAEHILLQNGFLINYARFRSYFAYDALHYEDEWEEDNCDEVSQSSTPSRQGSVGIPPMVLDSAQKHLRFNEEVDLISINRLLPVDHVLYEKLSKEL
ncbi:hypothetical protein CANMA_003934 [Candida margitis]|uniref:uncharacterized protein n=1 Tax=Candida margitis TaxID=1775924 RepID=UPI0022262C56|nr:uncharacterized protein CANMA_003934 [Candida margitis]KAI5961160.1 hypothetical protein CANMA_003934 [Candida margitis]